MASLGTQSTNTDRKSLGDGTAVGDAGYRRILRMMTVPFRAVHWAQSLPGCLGMYVHDLTIFTMLVGPVGMEECVFTACLGLL